ncbi:sialidase family protein [Cohnella fermenti]|uniref:Exo-alpha-sialidase n=1 Tax=Cohnella fermenti TaxID=2565925 RepID=A0A4S4BGV5_9BACL|nr:sialidase family protein [Cohnella fermenti]THF73601.1 exo-alpha-sialidase [Cohnella fermenti]
MENEQMGPGGIRVREWERSKPDIVVFVPEEDRYVGDNEHFLVFRAANGDWLALWTQSSVEGYGDNHLVLSRSRDQVGWEQPRTLAGSHPGQIGGQASWGFPIVTDKGRIYIFYTKDIGIPDLDSQTNGEMGVLYSDDHGVTFRADASIPIPRNRYDHPDERVPRNWIVWQKPIRDSRGRRIVGVTQWSSPASSPPPPKGWYSRDSRAMFLRFDNIDEHPDSSRLSVAWLPGTGLGLEVPYPGRADISVAQEPSVALLPDGRLFAVMRTFTGFIWYALSGDDGETWTAPRPLRYRDGGDPIMQPIASCPLFELENGAYLLVFHNNDGHVNGFEPHHALRNRRPAYVSLGVYRSEDEQPIRFSEPHLCADNDDVIAGPKKTSEIATYPSLTQAEGRTVLWYPDRKYYLLGKVIPDEWLQPAAE